MITLSIAGRAALATLIKHQPIHLAWGEGDASWSTPPLEVGTETALMAEVGRRQATEVVAVVEDPAGDIVFSETEKYRRTTGDSRHIYILTDFALEDASGVAISETALFIGTEVDASLPLDQRYFTPDQVTNQGSLLRLENHAPIYRFPNKRERFEVVITL